MRNSLEYTDLVFPHGNEEHLAQMAQRLGVRHLILCYELKDPLLRERAKEVAMLSHDGFTAEFAVLVASQQDVSRARNYTKSIVATARPELFEDKRVAYVIDFESGRRDDFIHHRNSGLNQVFIENAKRTGKVLLVNAHNLIAGKLPQAVILGRIMQNNTFFRKYRPGLLVVSGAMEPLEMRAPRDLQNLLNI
jgi:RNase P/RNase MRP subunit p30